MRTPFLRQFGLLALLCLVTVVLPAQLRADSDNTYTINGAVVRVVVKGGNTYLAVKSGTLKLNYADGRPMASLTAPSTFMLKDLKGALKVTASGLQMTKKQAKRLLVAVGAGSKSVKVYSDTTPSKSRTMEPNTQASLFTKSAQRATSSSKFKGVAKSFKLVFKRTYQTLNYDALGADRNLLSTSF